MSEYQFKVGDKVLYKAEHKRFAKANNHDSEAVYTVNAVDDEMVYFVESGRYSGCFASRLELAEDSIPETFDYRQALKILAENPEAEIESKAEDMDWHNILLGKEFILYTNALYRLKPQPKKYQWLYKTKDGRYLTTFGEYFSREDVESNFQDRSLIFIKPLNEETL